MLWRSLVNLCIVTCLGAFSVESLAAENADGPLLGSPDFKPTADHPLGWRGDWTGRFPGANPPTEWSRRVKGITSQIKYQAAKPSGEPNADSQPLEYFTIKEWLVAGPFGIDDPAADIEKDFLGGEDKTEPTTDAKAGETTWKRLRTGIDNQSTHYHNEGTCGDLNVDFVYVYGDLPASGMAKIPKSLDKKVAYAHSYIHAPEAAV